MGKPGITATTGSKGTTFTPLTPAKTQKQENKQGVPVPSATSTIKTGYTRQDTFAPSSPEKAEKREGKCCPAQERLSNWFGGISCVGKVFFVLGSILTGGLLYLITLIGFACGSAD
jgi:hypothetical protein